MFKTIQNNNLKLNHTARFRSDGKLVNRDISPFPNFHFFSIICGKSGSGKTSLLIDILKDKKIYRKVFNKILLVMPRHSYQNMDGNIFKRLPNNQVHFELNFEILHEQISEFANDDKNTLLVIDDFTAYLNRKDYLRRFNELIQNRRHLRLSIVLLVQVYNSIPLQIRKSVNQLILFNAPKKEFNFIMEELIEMPNDTALRLKKFIFDASHNFMLLDVQNQTYYKNLDKIVLRGEEENEEV